VSTTLVQDQAAAERRQVTRRVVLNLDACIECYSCAAACFYGHSEIPIIPEARTGAAALPVICRQCKQPACVTACTVGAARRDAEGVVFRSAYECRGCGSCALACPFGVIRLDVVGSHIARCDLCKDRTEQDQMPRCVAACPAGALQFIEQDEAERQGFVLLGSRTVGFHPLRRR